MQAEADSALMELLKTSPKLTVECFVSQLSKRQGIRVDEAARRLYKLWEEEKIYLEDPKPPRSVLGYTWSLYSLWFWMLASVVALTMLSIYLLPQKPPYIYLRYAVGSLSVLYLPGYALIGALCPKKEDYEPLERIALSIGLSLTLTLLVGMVLNYTPWGIRLNPLYTSLSSLTLILASMAVSRKFDYFMMKVDTSPQSVVSEVDENWP